VVLLGTNIYLPELYFVKTLGADIFNLVIRKQGAKVNPILVTLSNRCSLNSPYFPATPPPFRNPSVGYVAKKGFVKSGKGRVSWKITTFQFWYHDTGLKKNEALEQ